MLKKNMDENLQNTITFLNMPIDNDNDDKIGIRQHALELKDVIEKGAKTIAITSDFGGGKSSLTKYLESLFDKYTTKFCYINLWSDNFSENDRLLIHRSFVYQLADQISHTRGNYVSKRLSKNYGMFRLSLPNSFFSFLSFVMLLLILIGLACTTIYESITNKIVDLPIHNELGIFSFVVAAIIAILFFFKADIVFSAKQSGNEKEIDEHELIDIYRSYICKFHWRRFIVVIEDLDRSSPEDAYNFIKEFRRYYTSDDNSFFSRTKFYKNFYSCKHLKHINKTNFIINIKPESKLQQALLKEDTAKHENLFPKIFDYVLDLKEINISNYDVVLDQLLKQYQKEFKQENIFDLKDDQTILECVPEFEWVIRGKTVDIRTIKTRLNIAIPLFIDLKRKFGEDKVSLKKCLASSYITTEYAEDYLKIKDIGFDELIERFVKKNNVDEIDVKTVYNEQDISDSFAKELSILIKRKLVDYGYKIYFYNAPKNIIPYSNQQNILANIILYDEKISDKKDFELLVENVSKTSFGMSTIKESLNSVQNIISVFPKCIFDNIKLFEIAYNFNVEVVWKTIEESLSYKDDSVEFSVNILNELLNKFFLKKGKEEYASSVKRICEIIVKNASSAAVIGFRRSLLLNCQSPESILLFKILYVGENPVITNSEIKSLESNYYLIGLVNFNSPNLKYDLIEYIHYKIILNANINLKDVDLFEDFYSNIYDLFEANTITKNILEFLRNFKIYIPSLEKLVFEYIYAGGDYELLEEYIDFVNDIVSLGVKLDYDVIDHICFLNIKNGLSSETCEQLFEAEKIEEYVLNCSNTDIDLIDFTNPTIIDTINSINYLATNIKLNISTVKFIPELFSLREKVINTGGLIEKYISLFTYPNPIIDEDLLNKIDDMYSAISIIDENQINSNNYKYISRYFSKRIRNKKEALLILEFVCSLDKAKIKKEFFESLDFEMIKYYQITKKDQEKIQNLLSDCYDFDSVGDIINFMAITKHSNKDFEQIIKSKIVSDRFDEYEEKYIEYINGLSRINICVIENYLRLKKYYPVSKKILDYLFRKKHYKSYVISKILSDKIFYMEIDKIDVLKNIYLDIFLTQESPKDIRMKMSQNIQFVNYCLSINAFVDIDNDELMMQFSRGFQTVDSINYIFENHPNLRIMYFSANEGFVDDTAEICFLNYYKSQPKIAASQSVYTNLYDKLSNRNLKKSLTYAHNKALNR